jgi:glucose-6-phosphate isomerase
MVSRGTTDQHSQLQLWLEGPKDKIFTVLGLKEYPSLKLPEEFPRDETYCLWGKEMGEILLSEKKATEFVLEERGCPFYRIDLRNSAKALGGLFFLWEFEVLLLGEFYGIDPLTQPAVERGKRLTWGMLGRKGFEKERKEIEAWEK